ncbi:UDP-N-acetylmuramoyl-tripeptide--D-alanyl-D-alanine ligase [Lyticum sinuosum]|uniref:UDP-N-acetylmuramoyl-tripeptide--D-alanyl-D-alanine ligase n=1 Tax=Lyticum sinuosum TaxID=1332059 RepID=A0AAE5AGZ6_9RICK|nr:Mur ligase family protein [Lyticum sinuosum]MDZ5761387.1 UDP-N-acetylmuramoyl-tripeptide--D-alanyl-D-alanine ligase [Lyticum sinuosum]
MKITDSDYKNHINNNNLYLKEYNYLYKTILWNSFNIEEATGYKIETICFSHNVIIDSRLVFKYDLNKLLNYYTDDIKSLNKNIKTINNSCYGPIFVGLPGPNFNGGDFAEQALELGASLCFINSDAKRFKSERIIIVDNPYKIIENLAIYNRKRFKGKIVSVTGSCGKTTLKDMISSCISKIESINNTSIHSDKFNNNIKDFRSDNIDYNNKINFYKNYFTNSEKDSSFKSLFKVFSSYRNFNNTIGLPLMLSNMHPENDYAVLEMGMNRKGEIANMTEIAQPDVTTITNIYPAHIGCFSSIQDIIEAKSEIFLGLNNGIAIIPYDTTGSLSLINTAEKNAKIIIIYGINVILNQELKDYLITKFNNKNRPTYIFCNAKIQNNNDNIYYSIKLEFFYINKNFISQNNIEKIKSKHKFFYKIKIPTEQTIINSIACLCSLYAVLLINYDDNQLINIIQQSSDYIKDFIPSLGRGGIVNGKIENTFIIDDTYNANPGSVEKAINSMILYKNIISYEMRLIVILGDMLELGSYSHQMHIDIINICCDSGINIICTFGKEYLNSATYLFGDDIENGKYIHNKNNKKIFIQSFSKINELFDFLKKEVKENDLILVKGSRSMNMQRIVDYLAEKIT